MRPGLENNGSTGGPARLNPERRDKGVAAGGRPVYMFTVYEVKSKNAVLKIYYDEDCRSPRERDNLGTIICWHRKYNLGDEHNYDSPDDFWYSLAEEIVGDTDKVEQMTLEQREKVVRENTIILPLYLYDHGIRSMSTSSFVGRAHHAEWDSGQVGWIYVTKEKVREEYGVKRITKKVCNRVIAVLKAEVKKYSQWLEGDVYGYILEDTEGNNIDSRWGFFGTNWKENGMANQIPAEYHFLLEEAV